MRETSDVWKLLVARPPSSATSLNPSSPTDLNAPRDTIVFRPEVKRSHKGSQGQGADWTHAESNPCTTLDPPAPGVDASGKFDKGSTKTQLLEANTNSWFASFQDQRCLRAHQQNIAKHGGGEREVWSWEQISIQGQGSFLEVLALWPVVWWGERVHQWLWPFIHFFLLDSCLEPILVQFRCAFMCVCGEFPLSSVFITIVDNITPIYMFASCCCCSIFWTTHDCLSSMHWGKASWIQFTLFYSFFACWLHWKGLFLTQTHI